MTSKQRLFSLNGRFIIFSVIIVKENTVTRPNLSERVGRIKEYLCTDGVRALLPECLWAFAIGGAPAFLGVTPFGVAMLCSARHHLPPITVALCLGAAARGQGMLIPIYLFILCFRLIGIKWLGETGRRVDVLLSCVSMTVYGLTEFLLLRSPASALKLFVGSATATAFTLIREQAEDGEAEGRAALLYSVYAAACAAKGLSLYGIGIDNVLGFIICINLSRYTSPTCGCAAGALWGVGCAPEYAPAFAVSALIGGRATSPLLGVGGGGVFCMLFATFVGGYHGIKDFLPDIAVAAAVYAPISNTKWMKWTALTPPPPPVDEDRSGSEKEKRLAAVAGALGSLSAIFYGMSDRLKESDGYESSKDMTGTFADDYAAMSELICTALKEDEAPDDPVTAGKVYGMLRVLRLHPRRVRATGGRIKRIHIFALPASSVSDPALLQKRISNLCSVAFLPPVITATARGVDVSLTAAPAFSVKWHHAARTKPGETVSGDCSTAFTTEHGRFCSLLCDGMGSGKEAAIASRTCCVFLQKMLEGGADPALSVKMLNTFLRGKGYECFATVDIFCLDLYTGEAFFIKGGSAPSHLFRSGAEYTLASATAPVGIIREVYAERITFDAKNGDVIVMKSDGAEGDSPPRPPYSRDPRSAAEEIVSEAVGRGTRDDVTVCVINISRAEE